MFSPGTATLSPFGRAAPIRSTDINTNRLNFSRLPGVALSPHITATSDLRDLAGVGACLLVLPAQQTPGFVADHLSAFPQAPLVFCAKGISLKTHDLQTDTDTGGLPKAVLTGPGFAGEIATGLPTALTLAASEPLVTELQGMLSRRSLRVYRSGDMIGAQLGGALKNVIAISAGIAIGAGLGESARAAIMTRGFAEMRRLARAMGAQDETLSGLSGFGDLALTCGSAKSRNYSYGIALGSGSDPGTATTEGIATATAVVDLAAKHGVEMPISVAVSHIISGRLSVGDAMEQLLARPPAKEE